MQVDPIKSKLKPPETKRLKLTFDILLSNFALKFNLRRYALGLNVVQLNVEVRGCMWTILKPVLTSPIISTLEGKM